MVDVKDILARIQAGENPENIANEFADAVNAAIKLNDEEIQKQREKEAAAAKETDLNAKAQAILDALNDYISLVNPELAAELVEDDGAYSVADIRGIIDTALAGVQLSLSFAKKFAEPEKSAVKPAIPVSDSADDRIRNFIKNFIG